MYKDLQTYKTLINLKEAEETFARRIVAEVRRDRDKISSQKIFVEQSKLIKRINVELGKGVYNNFVPNYKTMATIGQLFSDSVSANEKVLLEDKVVDEMTRADVKTEKEIMEHIDNLTYKTFADKFNKEYQGKLHEEQRNVVTKYIYSVSDNGLSLKSYLNEEVSRLKDKIETSLNLEEFVTDENMLESAKKVLSYLESLKEVKLDEEVVKKIMQIQGLIREIETNE